MKTKLENICKGYVKNIALKDLCNNNGTYPIYGASGYIKDVDFYVSDCEYLGIVKDGAGVGRVDKYPAYSSLLGTMQYIVPNNDIDINYLKYLLISLHLENGVSGAAIPHIYYKNYKNTSVNICPIEEQKTIANYLDSVNNAISLAKQRLSALDELVKSRFIEMFGAPLSDEYTTPFTNACTFNPKKTEKKDWTDDLLVSFVPMPLVSEQGQIQTNNIKPYSEVKKGFTYFRENDVLFAKITPCMENGKGAIAINLQNGIGFGSTEFHVFRPIENISNPYWIYYLTAIDSFRIMAEKKMTGSAGQKRVPISFFENLKVNLPPIELQNEFAEFVKLIDKSKFIVQQQIKDLEELLDRKMDEYFR